MFRWPNPGAAGLKDITDGNTEDLESLVALFNRHLHCTLAQDLTVATSRDFYLSLAYVGLPQPRVWCVTACTTRAAPSLLQELTQRHGVIGCVDAAVPS